MSLTYRNLVQLFHNLRYSVGIIMLFNGFPIIFFVRDTLRIGPASNIFTLMFFTAALVLLFPTHFLAKLYKPNFKLLKLSTGFLVVATYHYFLFNNTNPDHLVEFGNLVFYIGFIFLLLHIPNNIASTLIPILFLSALFSNLTLVYSLIKDPNWVLGMRAAVSFGDPNARGGGNPHASARNAIICMLAAFQLLRTYKNFFAQLFLIGNIFFSIGVVIFTQSRSSLLSFGLMAAAFLFLQAKPTDIKRIVKAIFSIQTLILIGTVYIAIQFLIRRFSNFYGIILGYWDTFLNKMLNIVYTATGIKLLDTVDIDHSAMGRVTSLSYFNNALNAPSILVFGKGYKDSYMDVPLIESLINHGVFGGFFFIGFALVLLSLSLREIYYQRNPLTVFLGYFYMYLFTMMLTNGRPYDLSYWFPFAVYIRFMGIDYLVDPTTRKIL